MMLCKNKFQLLAISSAVAGISTAALGQIAVLDKGHSLLLNSGLQDLGLYSDSRYGLDYNVVAGANLTGPMFFADPGPSQVLSTGHSWSLMISQNSDPSAVLTDYEAAHKSDLFAVQVGDEQQGDIESPTSQTTAWFQNARAQNDFSNQLLYVNSFFINSTTAYANFIANANPDALSFDSYPFSNPDGHYITSTNWLSLAQTFRRFGLGSYIGATGTAARPYGMYVQTFHDEFAIDPGEAEMRWQQFAGLTMGYTFFDAFIFQGGNNHFYDQTTPLYSQYSETARQVRNLGPAMTRLISYSNGAASGATSIVRGQDANGNITAVPGGWQDFHAGDAPPNQPYFTSISNVANLGTKNNGHPGDVYVGFFNPLLSTLGDPNGEAYFMVTNGLGGSLVLPNGSSDNTALVSETQQTMTLNFDFGVSGIETLQRMRRSDGRVEVVPLTHVSGNTYTYTFTLDGGTGDLFKYNDGTSFVGAPVFNAYWDSDASAANNNVASGAGMGGSGTWDSSSSKWSSGSANSAWAANQDAIFQGAPGAVTLASPQTANSLTMHSSYTLAGSTLTMLGSMVTVDSGATATIASVIAGNAGVIKSGSGVLALTGTNTFTGGTMINGGVVRISSDANLGAVPTALTSNIVLNGTTLQFGANFDLNNNRAITIGPLGGTIDTNGFSTINGFGIANTFQGPGDLTKTGTGTVFISAATGGLNTLWTGRLIIQQGTWKIVATDGLPFNPNTVLVLQPGEVTLNGGTWQFGKNIFASSPYRGVTVSAGGGTIDTQGFNVTWAGPITGSFPSSTLTKIGPGSLTLNSPSFAGSFTGNVNVSAGSLVLSGGSALGTTMAINVAGGASLTIATSQDVGAISGDGTISLGSQTLTLMNNSATTFGGVIAGAGAIAQAGGGTLTVNNLRIPGVNISSGMIKIAQNGGTGGASLINSLSIAGTAAAPTGRLDLNDNDLAINYSGTSPIETIRSLLAAGFNAGSWDGMGIASSAAHNDATMHTALGYAEASSVGMTTTFDGQSIDSTTVLVKYTDYGDSNLDGKVDVNDFRMFLDGFAATSGSSWSQGDYSYDGKVDLGNDFNLFLSGYLSQNGALGDLIPAIVSDSALTSAQKSELLSAVPEPVVLPGAVFAVALLKRRRK
jgi:autotransporter-associated beta strand protein/predicted outer membrane repeat protein